MKDDWFEWILYVTLAGFFVITMVSVAVLMWADKKCLEAGYPKSAVTYDFSIYCMNLDGSLTIKVNKQ